jgi:phosphoglycerate transport regulatory protein PgtC
MEPNHHGLRLTSLPPLTQFRYRCIQLNTTFGCDEKMIFSRRAFGKRLALGATALAMSGWISPASAGNDRVVVLTAYPDDMVTLFETAFAKAHPGIDVQVIWAQSHEAAMKLRSPDQGGIDVYWAPSLHTFPALGKAGAFQPLAVDRAALPGRIGAQSISDPAGQYEAFEVAGYGIVLDPAAAAKLGLTPPKTWADLAGAAWQGHVTLPDAGPVGFAPALYDIILQAEGWERGWALITEIAGNATLQTVGPMSALAVQQGEAVAGLAIDFITRAAIANGQALAMIYPGRTAFLPAHVAITRTASHPEAARAFVDFLLGPEGQALLFRPDVARYPVRPAAYEATPAGTPDPFARPADTAFAYDADLGVARAGLIAALFEQAITRRHDRQVALWADLHRAEAALAKAPDAALAADLAEARRLATMVPVTAAEAADTGFAAPFRHHAAGHGEAVEPLPVEADWASRLDQAQAEAETRVARVLAALPAAH